MSTPSLQRRGHATTRKPSVEHIVLGAVLLAVVLAAGWWFLLRSGPAKAPVVAATDRPAVAAMAQPGIKPVAVPHGPAGPPLSRTAYRKAGNAICAARNAQYRALGAYPTSAAAQGKYVAAKYGLNERARRRLVALHAPATSAKTLKKSYSALAHVDVMGTSLRKAVLAGHTATAKALQTRITDATATVDAALHKAGLTSCAF